MFGSLLAQRLGMGRGRRGWLRSASLLYAGLYMLQGVSCQACCICCYVYRRRSFECHLLCVGLATAVGARLVRVCRAPARDQSASSKRMVVWLFAGREVSARSGLAVLAVNVFVASAGDVAVVKVSCCGVYPYSATCTCLQKVF
jgi:hypothetical protein